MNQPFPAIEFLDRRSQRMAHFADQCHGEQVRKYTGARYVNHLIAVCRIVMDYSSDARLLAVALGHDLYEDTSCTPDQLKQALLEFGYLEMDIAYIHERIVDLTDIYEKKNYPRWNRRKRKTAEAERLWKVAPGAQTVKYADIIDNSLDLLRNDRDFGRRYLSEASMILKHMDQGEKALYHKAVTTVEDGLKELSQ